ncbi:MAG: hypothetical protein CVT77_11870 [Alphaproteobacteria bacterium HGW-Alphaproteobacteria-16]|nr:MAG: hypothetical protein CVT77_11870 [Alphaproteobacteria bacterium HGW-Alphaproteobacteria-16]
MDSTATNVTPGAINAMLGGMTTLHFVLIALFAVGAIAILIRGRYLKRLRKEADAEIVENNEIEDRQNTP